MVLTIVYLCLCTCVLTTVCIWGGLLVVGCPEAPSQESSLDFLLGRWQKAEKPRSQLL